MQATAETNSLQAAILDFSISALVTQYSHPFHCIAGPQKRWWSRLNFVDISSVTEDMYIWTTSQAAILDFAYPVWSHSIPTHFIALLDPKNVGVAA